MSLSWGWLLAAVLLFGCGGGSSAPPDAATSDAATAPSTSPRSEIVSGSGRVSGATYTVDVEIGHPMTQAPVSSPTYNVQGSATVAP